jgi:hypothetical protein
MHYAGENDVSLANTKSSQELNDIDHFKLQHCRGMQGILNREDPMKRILVVAGSDSSGGA